MKYLLVVLAFVCSFALATKPDDILSGKIVAVGACNQMTCVAIEKNGERYIVMGVMDGDTLDVIAIYIVEGKKLRQVWGWDWREA